LRFRLFDVRNGDDIQRAFAAPNTGYDAITVGLEAVTQAHSKKCLPSLLRNYRLPAIYGGREFVDAGGLMFYGLSFPEIYHRAATYVDKICTAWRA
jgi:putative ABC transport system substrate-binding protein